MCELGEPNLEFNAKHFSIDFIATIVFWFINALQLNYLNESITSNAFPESYTSGLSHINAEHFRRRKIKKKLFIKQLNGATVSIALYSGNFRDLKKTFRLRN